MSKLTFVVATLCVAACDDHATTAALQSCQAIAQAAPSAATIAVGGTVTVSLTLDGACPAPLVRNETRLVVQVDSLSTTSIRITGRASGSGNVRVRSGVDTLVSTVIAVTVTP